MPTLTEDEKKELLEMRWAKRDENLIHDLKPLLEETNKHLMEMPWKS